mgnify:CR=1 FL=1
MYVIKALPEFDAWLKSLSDKTAQRRLVARLRKASLGNLGDVNPVGKGVVEMREHFGACWRMYYTLRGDDRGGARMKRKKVKASDLPEFDPAEYLDSDEAVAEYLTAVLAEGDAALLAAALGDIARARGMSDIAKSTGLAREALYKALRPGAQPRFDTVSRVCAALGVRLVAEPVS